MFLWSHAKRLVREKKCVRGVCLTEVRGIARTLGKVNVRLLVHFASLRLALPVKLTAMAWDIAGCRCCELECDSVFILSWTTTQLESRLFQPAASRLSLVE